MHESDFSLQLHQVSTIKIDFVCFNLPFSVNEEEHLFRYLRATSISFLVNCSYMKDVKSMSLLVE